MTEALDRSTLWLQEKTCSAIAEAATSSFFRADGAPATDGPRISLFAQCTHGDTQHKGCCRPRPSCG